MNYDEVFAFVQDVCDEVVCDGYVSITPYGSHLYGTNTPKSDWDFKVIYLPRLDKVLLGHKHQNFKKAFDSNFNPVSSNRVMPEQGIEIEFITLQTFLKDFYDGQTYAVELAYAINQNFGSTFGSSNQNFDAIVEQLINNYNTFNVKSMVGFASKQTFDIIHRGKRLNVANAFLRILNQVLHEVAQENIYGRMDASLRLDNVVGGVQLFDVVKSKIKNTPELVDHVKEVQHVSKNRTFRAFEFSGRTYLDTTPFSELIAMLNSTIDKYGSRVITAAESDIDPKSLMHAVRVYEQVIELLTSGNITFPRPNAELLLGIKNAVVNGDWGEVTYAKERLVQYEQIVNTTNLSPRESFVNRDDYEEFSAIILASLYEVELPNYNHEKETPVEDVPQFNLGFEVSKFREHVKQTVNQTHNSLKDMYSRDGKELVKRFQNTLKDLPKKDAKAGLNRIKDKVNSFLKS